MQSSILDRYFAVNPQRINPFNAPTHDFASSGDLAADARYLAAQRLGLVRRFYVTLSGPAHHPNLLIVDKHNGNIVASFPTPRHPNPYAGSRDIASHVAHHATHLAASIGADYWPDVSPVHRLQAYRTPFNPSPLAVRNAQAVPA